MKQAVRATERQRDIHVVVKVNTNETDPLTFLWTEESMLRSTSNRSRAVSRRSPSTAIWMGSMPTWVDEVK